MVDPLAEVVTMLQPRAASSKLASGSGRWRVRRAESGRPFYCAVIDGAIRLTLDGRAAIVLQRGDFVLVPSAFDFTATSLDPPRSKRETPYVVLPSGEVRHGDPSGAPEVRMLVGYCVFGSSDAGLLVSLLPELVCVRGDRRLATLVELVRDESRTQRPAREIVLARLLEVLFIEALRSSAPSSASVGLVRGLADEHVSIALRRMHDDPARVWTVARLAKEAALSRSAFFERFRRTVGVAPIEYLLAWRMALAKGLLRRNETTVAQVAQRVGYRSGSTFSVAFTRHVGVSPTRYARDERRDALRGDGALGAVGASLAGA